jgi:hypothetical protein
LSVKLYRRNAYLVSKKEEINPPARVLSPNYAMATKELLIFKNFQHEKGYSKEKGWGIRIQQACDLYAIKAKKSCAQKRHL